MRSSLRVLFFLHSLGYLRFFDPVLRELLDRGHAVHLLFERDDHDDSERAWLAEMEEMDSFTWSHTQSLRSDRWRPFAMRVRSATDAARFYAPPFRDSGYLFVRAEHRAPRWFRWVASTRPGRSGHGIRLLNRWLGTVESAIPSSRGLKRELESHRPDVFVLCPHLMPGMRHSDYLAATRALGVPSVLAVASWDNLSSKQLLHEVPEQVLVWNEIQAEEAVRLHAVPSGRIAITGAQPFDQWFGWEPRERDAFCARVGLDPERPYVLYIGGSLFPARVTEADWARGWLDEIRADSALREVGILFRPHPNRGEQWEAASLAGVENVAIWPPRHSEMPLAREARADLFDSIHHSFAVFGLNTSAMIDAAVIGRPVHTLFAEEFAASQTEVFHFDYLLRERGGIVTLASSFDELRAHLRESLAGDDDGWQARRRRFLETFVRPHGPELPATPRVVDAIEKVAASGAAPPERAPWSALALRLPLELYVRLRHSIRRLRYKVRAVAAGR